MRDGDRAKCLPIITTRHDSFSVEYHSSHRQVSGTQEAETRACSRVCEWDRNEQNQSGFNRAPIGLEDLGVLTIHQVFGLAYYRKSSVFAASAAFFIDETMRFYKETLSVTFTVPLFCSYYLIPGRMADSLSKKVPLIKSSTHQDCARTSYRAVRYDCSADHCHFCSNFLPPLRPPLNLKTCTCWTGRSLFASVESVQGWRVFAEPRV